MKKELLAKLLATENITVVQQNVETASFDVKNRVLTLPVWNDELMNEDTEDHLTGHEVGHALYTPADEWLAAVTDASKGFRTFINVVEDARIERMIQVRYPGLRRSFIRSYNNMLDNGFFGKSKEAVNTYKLIDRLNVHFKCGTAADVEFAKDEMPWVDEIGAAETFAEVVDIANRLYDLAKEELEKEKEALENINPSAMEFGDGEYEDDNLDDGSEEADSMEDASFGPTDGDEDSDDMGEDDREGLGEEEEDDEESLAATDGSPEEPSSATDEILNNSIKSEYSSKDTIQIIGNLKLNTKYPTDNVVPYKDILQRYNDPYYNSLAEIGKDMFKKFQTNNRSVINYMVKEFEMKKRASEYSRTTLAKTGVIDPVKMNNYRYSDDIFRKMEVVPEGKNHGLLMYLDWSGSMAHDLLPTVEQLMNLVMFCKQVQIPFRVFAFSDCYSRGNDQDSSRENTDGILEIDAETSLIELFSNKMVRSDFSSMCNILMATAGYYMFRYNNKANLNKYYDIVKLHCGRIYNFPDIPQALHLGGTPLQSAIIGAIPVYRKFKTDNRLDIVTTIFLTDGESHHITVKTNDGKWTDFMNGRGYKKITITDPDTRKSLRLPRMERRQDSTSFLLKMYNTFTESKSVGFRILPYNKRAFRTEISPYISTWNQGDEFYNTMKTDNFIIIPNSGYSKFFGIAGGKKLETANTSITVADDAKKGAITTAFKKANNNRKSTRVMLNKFIDIVA